MGRGICRLALSLQVGREQGSWRAAWACSLARSWQAGINRCIGQWAGAVGVVSLRRPGIRASCEHMAYTRPHAHMPTRMFCYDSVMGIVWFCYGVSAMVLVPNGMRLSNEAYGQVDSKERGTSAATGTLLHHA